MKVVFPCKGSIVLLKDDLEILKQFYSTSINTSKLKDFYNISESMIQVGSLNYIPKNNNIMLNDVNLLTIKKMREIIGIYSEEENTKEDEDEDVVIPDNDDDKISDDDLLSNPFFTTLKPINS